MRAPGDLIHSWVRLLAPGERRTLLYFLSQNADRASAVTQGETLRDLGRSALVGLSDAERAAIVNFALP